MKRALALAAALLAPACVEDVTLARVASTSDGSVAPDSPPALDGASDAAPEAAPGDAPGDATLDASEDATGDVSDDVSDAPDVSDDVSDVGDASDASDDVSDASDDVSDASDDASDAAMDAPRDAPRDSMSDGPRDATGDVAADAPRDATGDAPGSVVVAAVVTVDAEGASASEWRTDIDVTLTRGMSIMSATVTWSSSIGAVTLTPVSGHYRGTQTGYASAYDLTVAMGEERPITQRWSALPGHAITFPPPGFSHPALIPLAVTWAPTGASEAQFIAPMTQPATADTGIDAVPATFFPRGAGTVVIRLRRRRVVTFTGFGPGSSVRTDITASVPVAVVP